MELNKYLEIKMQIIYWAKFNNLKKVKEVLCSLSESEKKFRLLNEISSTVENKEEDSAIQLLKCLDMPEKHKKSREDHSNAFDRWTEDEELLLINLFNNGLEKAELSDKFQRSERAIHLKLAELKISEQTKSSLKHEYNNGLKQDKQMTKCCNKCSSTNKIYKIEGKSLFLCRDCLNKRYDGPLRCNDCRDQFSGGKLIEIEIFGEVNNRILNVCGSCREKLDYDSCNICTYFYPTDQIVQLGNGEIFGYSYTKKICKNCLNRCCSSCGDHLSGDEIYGFEVKNRTIYVCHNCRNKLYYICDQCEDLYPTDEVVEAEDFDKYGSFTINLCKECNKDFIPCCFSCGQHFEPSIDDLHNINGYTGQMCIDCWLSNLPSSD